MRKRKKEQDSQTDNAENFRGSKSRHKEKPSDKFIRELQSWTDTVVDVKRLYKDVINRRLVYAESPTEASSQVISSGTVSPAILHQNTLPLSESQTPVYLSSPANSGVHNSFTKSYIESFNKVSSPPILNDIRSPVIGDKDCLPHSAPPSPAGVYSPTASGVQDPSIKKLCFTVSLNEVSTPPISCGTTSPVTVEEDPVLMSVQRHPADVNSSAAFKLQDSPTNKIWYTESLNEFSTPPIPSGATTPVNLQEEPLPPSVPRALAGVSSPASSKVQDLLISQLGCTESPNKVSTSPIPRRAVVSVNLEEDSLLYSVPGAPASVKTDDTSKVQASLCYPQDFRKVSAPPNSSCLTSPRIEENTFVDMLQTPKAMDSPTASRFKAFSEDAKSDSSGNIKHVHVKAAQKAPFSDYGDGSILSPCHEPPTETYLDTEAVKGSDSFRVKLQDESLSRPPLSKTAVVEVSHIVSFLQRLIKCGVQIDLARAPGCKKDSMISHQGACTQQKGAEDSKGRKSKQSEANFLPPRKSEEDLRYTELRGCFQKSSVSVTESQEAGKGLESQKQSMASLLFSVDTAKESREAVTEKSSPLLPTRGGNNAEGLKDPKPDKEVAAEISSFLISRMEQLASESDEGDGDLKQLWDDMEFSLACTNESRRNKAGPDNNNKDGCNHDFFKKDDVGLVCSLCGLVGEDTEHIFNYIWAEGSRKRHSRKHGIGEKGNADPAEEEASNGSDSPPMQQTHQVLVLHPQYRDKIRVHQEEGIQFLQRNLVQGEPNGCILAHAPGTGKSFLIIAFLQSFQTCFPDERPLIIAPNGMLSVWVREFQKWKVEDTRIFNLYEASSLQELDENDKGALSQRRHGQLEMLQQWKAQKSVLLVGYPTFSRLISGNDAPNFPGIRRLLLEVPGLLIMDEGHFPRNKDTQILKSLSQVHTRRRVLLTGTLFQNNFYELYNLYHLVRPDFMSLNASCTKHILEDYMKSNAASPGKMRFSAPSPKGSKQRSRKEDMELRLFENLGEIIKSTEDAEKKRQAISQLRELSEPFVHWYKGQVLDELPGLVDLTLFLKLTQVQEDMLCSLQAKVENQLDLSIKSMKVCIHPSLVADAAHINESLWKKVDMDASSSPKMMFIIDLLRLAAPRKEKVLLFSQLLDPFYLLERMLKREWGWRFNREILKIEGQTSLEERESVIDRFNQNPKSRILCASIKTCGEGVSLIGASRIVLLDVQWNPMVSRQAISRAFRIGQIRKVYVYRLVGGGAMEEYAHKTASEKEWLAKQVIEGCSDEDYDSYCHEVDPQGVDAYFESPDLRENVIKCLRYHFV